MQDILIIGGGIAGASAAYSLTQRGRQVTLLEAEHHCGMHTTGRSAALFIEGYGNAAIRAFTRASRSFFTTPPSGFCEGPLLSPRGVLVVGAAGQGNEMDALLAETAAASVVPMEQIDAAAARAIVPVLREDYVAHALLDRAAMDIDVDALHQGFLRGMRRNGGTIITDARVDRIDRVGGTWRVSTKAGVFEAAILVNAAGAWADQIATLAGVAPLGLVPKRRTALLVDAPPDSRISGWPGVIDVSETFYFKPSSGKLLLSPADETPSEPGDAQPDEMDIAIAVDRVQQAADIPVRHVARSWAGLRSFFPDKTPAVGWDSDVPDFFWLAGQGGYGIQTAPALGETTAAIIEGKPLPEGFADEGADPALLSPGRLRPTILA